jgi:hypothetical protein
VGILDVQITECRGCIPCFSIIQAKDFLALKNWYQSLHFATHWLSNRRVSYASCATSKELWLSCNLNTGEFPPLFSV